MLLGLSLLGVNHKWAKQWMETVKYKGTTLKKYLFPANNGVRLFYDIGSIFIVSGALYLVFTTDSRIAQAAGVSLVMLGVIIFLFNRDRLDSFMKKIRRHP